MAGAGIKLWATADTVTATEFQTYLQEQIVAVFDDSSARDAAFGGAGEPTVQEGMCCYLKDTNEFQIYSGSAWVALLDLDTFSVSSGNYTITSDLTVGGGDLSIGTTTAGETLNIAGVTTTSGVGSNLVVKGGDATGTNINGGSLTIKPGMGVGTGVSGDIHLQTGPAGSSGTSQNTATTVLTCTSAGDVVVANDLDLSDAGKITLGTGDDLQIYANGSNSFIDHDGDGDLWIRTLGAGEDMYLNAKDAMAFQTDSVTRIYINAATDVGIATTSPYEKLDVHGNIAINPEITFVPLTDGNAIGYINFHGFQGGATQYRDLGIYNGREGAYRTLRRLLGLRRHRPYQPAYRCDINEDTADAVPLRVEMSSGGTAYQYLARFTRNTGLLGNGIYCDTTNAFFGTPSDERIKRDITTIDPAVSLAAITALRPVDFRYIADPDDGEIRNGLIAQEVEPLIPAAVHTVMETEARMETVSVPRVETVVDDDGNETTVPVLDEDGNQIIDEDTQPVLGDDGKRIIDTTGDSKMLSWDAVNAHMVGAIKELTARIATLEAAA